jgi:hypothetical protein
VSKWTFAAPLLLAVVVAAGVIEADSPAEPASSGTEASPFSRPIVAITIKSDLQDLLLLSDAQVKKVGERQFIVGTGVDDEQTPDWRNKHTVWIAIDDIQQMVEFASPKEFRDSLKTKSIPDETKAASYRRPRIR